MTRQTPTGRAFDESAIRAHLETLHDLAAGIEGQLLLAVYGEHPAKGKKIAPCVEHFDIGDVDRMVDAVMRFRRIEHANVYAPLCVVRRGLEPGKRGTMDDVVAVFGLVVDLDEDAGKTGDLPRPPSLILQTSPKNRQAFYFLSHSLPVHEAKVIAKALRDATRADDGTSDPIHVWRIPGTLNWPNRKKVVERGRSTTPFPVRVASPFGGGLVDVDHLWMELIPVLKEQPGVREAPEPLASGRRWSDDLWPLIVRRASEGHDRSVDFFRAVRWAKSYGAGVDEIEAAMRAHPAGIAAKYFEGGDRLHKEIVRAFDKVGDKPPPARDSGNAFTGGEVSGAAAEPAAQTDPLAGELPDQGTAAAAVILDPRDPIHSARELVAARFKDRPGGLTTLHRHRGAFWQFAGSCYCLSNDETIRANIWTFLEKANRLNDKGKAVSFKPNRARVSDLLDALQAICELNPSLEPPAWLGDASDLPSSREILAVANGLLHISSGKLLSSTASYFCLSMSDITYDPDAPPPTRWCAFLHDLFGDDTQAIEALQDWFGYVLTTDTSQQKIMLIVGPGRSGKGTIARVQTRLVGRDNVAGPTLSSMSSNFGLEPLIGKPLAIISDARLGSRSDQAAIAERLLSISGEDALTIDRKFRSAWTGRLPARFMLLTNELPRLADNSGALAGRFIVLVLKETFYGREDIELEGRLLGELPAILNWAIVGYKRLRQRGHFVQPDSARDAIDDLTALASPITAFVQERCALLPGATTSIAALYAAWREWCIATGRREPDTIHTFGRDLRAAFPSLHITQPRKGAKRQRAYEGIALRC